jgi:hypothetical protein
MFEFFVRARGFAKGFKYEQDQYEKLFQSNASDFEKAIEELNGFIEVRFSPKSHHARRRK